MAALPMDTAILVRRDDHRPVGQILPDARSAGHCPGEHEADPEEPVGHIEHCNLGVLMLIS